MDSKLARLNREGALALVGMTVAAALERFGMPDNVKTRVALWSVFEEMRRDHGLIFRQEKGRIVTVDDPEKIARAAARAAKSSRRRLARQSEKVAVAANLTEDQGRARQLDRRAECYGRQAAMAKLVAGLPDDDAAAIVAHAAMATPRGKPRG